MQKKFIDGESGAKNYWWNKGDQRKRKRVSGKYWIICDHNTHVHLRTPPAIYQTFLFALCWNILTRAAFCLSLLNGDSFSMPFLLFFQLLFTDLRTQWFFLAQARKPTEELIKYVAMTNRYCSLFPYGSHSRGNFIVLSARFEQDRFRFLHESIFPSTIPSHI